jgi:uncharacterized protein (DUF1501 family)
MTGSRSSRREFLRWSGLGATLAWSYPAFLGATVRRALAAPEDGLPAPDAPVLVTLQLDGGNDGLNTIVPWRDDRYRAVRPTIALPEKEVLRLDDEIGLHPALADLADLIDRGRAAVVHAVGYPNPSRSHFRSTEIWQAAHAGERPADGWLGRWLDGATDAHPAAGVALAKSTPLALKGKRRSGVSFADADTFRPPEALPAPASAPATVSEGEGPLAPLDFLRRVESQAIVSADVVQAVLGRTRNAVPYPDSELARNLSVVARLVAGGAPTRVFHVAQGGYDTHAGQAGPHAMLLADLGEALAAFLADLERSGQLDRVVVLAFSEFGRRVAENASLGTDHGAAGPCLVLGGRVRPGFHGTPADLDPDVLLDGDVRPTTDFRSLYAELVDSWLGASSSAVLGGSFTPLRILRT